MPVDLINSIFPLLATVFILNHCRHAWRDKAVRGVSIISQIFFTIWAIWNIYYYAALAQWFSMYTVLFAVAANLLYVYLLYIYSRKET